MKPSRIKLEFCTFSAFLLAVIDAVHGVHHKYYHRAPIIDLNGAEKLIGTIREDERLVTVTPHLHILKGTGPVCHYELTPVDTSELPFETRVLDNALGTAQIQLREGAEIDCSDVEFQMRVVAVRCADDSSKSDPVLLKITIQDVNNHAPQFQNKDSVDSPWYTFEVEEGRVMEITRLTATDRDCGHPYGNICRYEITNPPENSPFRIDDQGVLEVIRPLNRSQTSSHILTVVAYDCGMLRSRSTLVTVHVKARCVNGIVPMPALKKPLTITRDKRSIRPFIGAEIIACGSTCAVTSAELEVRLNKNKNSDSMATRREECGLNANAIELLETNKTTVTTVDDAEQDGEFEPEGSELLPMKYIFDGKTSMTIPQEKVQTIVPEKFNFQFSMRMKASSDEEQKVKQNILCETDLNGLNRHHFAVYVRHCKLELLLRREPEDAEAEFRAAEWRWSDKRVCDDKWHSYAILFSDLDDVQLLVDGEVFNMTDRNPEILDDWPLHSHKNVVTTRLVVGACWHGRSHNMVQFFKGQLSAMYLLTANVENTEKIECLHKNNEFLLLNEGQMVSKGGSALMNKDHTKLRLKSTSVEGISLLLQNVVYATASDKISPKTRSISVSGQIICQVQEKKGRKNVIRPISTLKRDVQLSAEKKRNSTISITIQGQSTVRSDRKSLKAGTLLLPDIRISVVNGNEHLSDTSKNYKLDSCSVHMNPPRDMDLEFYSSPATLMSSLNVDFVHDKQGIMLKGKETAENYAKILTRIHYFNTRPESYRKRMYKLQCVMGNATSNEFSVLMEIGAEEEELKEAVEKLASLTHKIDEKDPKASSSSFTEGNNKSAEEEDPFGQMVKHFEPSFDQLGSNRLQNILEMDLPRPKALHSYDSGQTAIAGGAVAIIVVVCIGMLLVLLIVGVVKMRDDPMLRRRRSRRDSFEWDDNGLNLNLTLNPLEGMGKNKNDSEFVLPTNMYNPAEEAGEESSSEDGESYREDMSDEDGDNDIDHMIPLKENGRQGLEWDDDGTGARHEAKSYRV